MNAFQRRSWKPLFHPVENRHLYIVAGLKLPLLLLVETWYILCVLLAVQLPYKFENNAVFENKKNGEP